MGKDKCNWSPQKCYEKFPPCFAIYNGTPEKSNPGNIQELHNLAHKVMPKFFDGFEIDYTHAAATNKFFTANWIFSHNRPAGFRVGGQYSFMLEDMVLQTPTIRGDINPSTFATNLGFVFYPLHCLRFEGNLQRAADDMPLLTDLTLELKRNYSTLTGNLYNMKQESGRGTISYMQALDKNWAVGGELLIEWNEPKFQMAEAAFAARYTQEKWAIASSVSRQGLDVSYWQKLRRDISMASLFAWNRSTDKAIGTVCYQKNFYDSSVRGMIDSDFSLGFSYIRYLLQIPCAVSSSFLISMPTNRFMFGLRLTLDPSGFRRGE